MSATSYVIFMSYKTMPLKLFSRKDYLMKQKLLEADQFH